MTQRQTYRYLAAGTAIVGLVLVGIWYQKTHKKIVQAPVVVQEKPKPVVYSLNGTVKTISDMTLVLNLADGKSYKNLDLTSSVNIIDAKGNNLKLSDLKNGSSVIVYSKNDFSSTSPSVDTILVTK